MANASSFHVRKFGAVTTHGGATTTTTTKKQKNETMVDSAGVRIGLARKGCPRTAGLHLFVLFKAKTTINMIPHKEVDDKRVLLRSDRSQHRAESSLLYACANTLITINITLYAYHSTANPCNGVVSVPVARSYLVNQPRDAIDVVGVVRLDEAVPLKQMIVRPWAVADEHLLSRLPPSLHHTKKERRDKTSAKTRYAPAE